MIRLYLDNLGASFNSLGDDLISEGNPLSGAEAYTCSDNVNWIEFYWYNVANSYTDRLTQCLEWIDDNWPAGAPTVDMDAILVAMLAAEPDEVTYFIGLVDAYRAALWEQPFNAEFYAGLARGFMQGWE